MSTSPGLPSFTQPPVVEVALSAQFSGGPISAPQLGLYWGDVRDEFPGVEQQAPVPRMEERFTPEPPGVRVQVSSGPLLPRYLFVSPDRSRVIQVQSDRFGHNWRKAPVGGVYPRYDTPGSIRDTFEARFRSFVDRMVATGTARLDPDWCEITYLNHIRCPEGHGRLDRVLRHLRPADVGGWLPIAEDSTLVERYRMARDGGEPFGRLIVSAAPSFQRASGEPIIVLTLTARGLASPGEGVDGALAFLDTGREWIVRAFAEVTTDEMQIEWGREH